MNNIPEFLYKMLSDEYKKIDVNRIIEGLCADRPTTFRINTSKTDVISIKDKLNKFNIKYKESKWNETALIVEEIKEDKIKELDMYKNGEIYLQSLSSMIPAIVVNPKERENILDMAAAPGGKTTQMANLSDNKAMITACEKNKIRADRLKYNLEKQGVKNFNLMKEDSRNLSDYFKFDKILLDTPCSRKWNRCGI